MNVGKEHRQRICKESGSLKLAIQLVFFFFVQRAK